MQLSSCKLLPRVLTVLQAAEMHDGRADFMVELICWWHLHGVAEVQRRQAGVAEVEGAPGELFAQAYLQKMKRKDGFSLRGSIRSA